MKILKDGCLVSVLMLSCMDDMVECRFEGDEGKEALIEAIAERLPKVSGAVPDSSPSSDPTRVSIASALEALKFVELGL